MTWQDREQQRRRDLFFSIADAAFSQQMHEQARQAQAQVLPPGAISRVSATANGQPIHALLMEKPA